MKTIEIQRQAPVATLSGVFVLVLTWFEIFRAQRLKRGEFVKDYISKFYTDPVLFKNFHDLVYTYYDELYGEVRVLFAGMSERDRKAKPNFKTFESLQGERKDGCRLYHPEVFQGSVEESRLDALLGYFDVIGYYRFHRFIEISDIVGSLGYYLSVLSTRDVIKDYLKVCKDKWKDLPYQNEVKAPRPFFYLDELLKDVKIYNEKIGDYIKKLEKVGY